MGRKTLIVLTIIILGLAIGGGFLWFWKSKRSTCSPTLTVNFATRQVKFNWYCKGFGPSDEVVEGGTGNETEEEPSETKVECDAQTPCPEGKECYSFPDEEGPICWEGDPCEKCESKKCMTILSYPPSVICQDQ